MVDARFEVLGGPNSLLSVSLSASQDLFTRRGTLVGVGGKAENVSFQGSLHTSHSFNPVGDLEAFFAKAPPASSTPWPSISLSEDIFYYSFDSTNIYEWLFGCCSSGWFSRLEDSRKRALGMDGASPYS